jgi:hypothetical protein
MIKTVKINDISNTQLNENNYMYSPEWDIEPDKLNDEWDIYLEKNIDKINSFLCVDIDEITRDELDVFYNIFCDMMINNIKKFFVFYTNEIISKFNKNNKHLYKVDINLIIDRYITEQIKQIDNNIYKKFIGNNKRINNELIILLINDIWMEDDDLGYFNLYVLQFKKRMESTYYLNRIYNYTNK